MKGQKARSGSGGKLYHQGGNLPMFRRLPFKRGFTKPHRQEWTEINLDRLGDFPADSEISPETLLETGVVRDLEKPIVLLGRGEVSVPLKVRVHRISGSAKAAIEEAGGTVEVLEI
jgi:large subunit ribosomal protein L15